jgi:hypothetical protein
MYMTKATLLGKLCVLTVVVGLSTVPALAQAASSPESQTTLTGTVTSASIVNHQCSRYRADTLQSWTLRCVQNGSAYVLKVGDTVYPLAGNSKDLEHFAGGKATVIGVPMENGIQVMAVSKPGQMPETFGRQEPGAVAAPAR